MPRVSLHRKTTGGSLGGPRVAGWIAVDENNDGDNDNDDEEEHGGARSPDPFDP